MLPPRGSSDVEVPGHLLEAQTIAAPSKGAAEPCRYSTAEWLDRTPHAKSESPSATVTEAEGTPILVGQADPTLG